MFPWITITIANLSDFQSPFGLFNTSKDSTKTTTDVTVVLDAFAWYISHQIPKYS